LKFVRHKPYNMSSEDEDWGAVSLDSESDYDEVIKHNIISLIILFKYISPHSILHCTRIISLIPHHFKYKPIVIYTTYVSLNIVFSRRNQSRKQHLR
jgi:hypothetical protein